MIRRSRMRAPTWSSIAAVDRPLFGLAIPLTRVCLTKRAYGGLYRYQRDSSRIIPTRSNSTAIDGLSRTSARPGRTRRRARAEPRRTPGLPLWTPGAHPIGSVLVFLDRAHRQAPA